jgi:hypothetical protein
MPLYVLVNRRAGLFTAEQKSASRMAAATTLSAMAPFAKIVADHDPADLLARRVVVFEAPSDEMAANFGAPGPDVIVERAMPRELHAPPRRAAAGKKISTLGKPKAQQFGVVVSGGGGPLADIPVKFFLRDTANKIQIVSASTDAGGNARIQAVPTGQTVHLVKAIPHHGFWSVLEAPPVGGSLTCPPLPQSLAEGAGWWHSAVGVDLADPMRGSGIKVGVIDTGCGPHPNLRHVSPAGAFVAGVAWTDGDTKDVGQHGTHTTGIIGARPSNPGEFAGIAPGCDLLHARVFTSETPEGGPTQADLINAIDALSRDHHCDLINISLGGLASPAEEDAIRDAAERGTLCICSAGNDSGPVAFPAGYAECAAVSAIGQVGWAPAGTASAVTQPSDPARQGSDNFFFASFSSYGSQVACAGPGVGIISTVPDAGGAVGSYMVMDGTSMASPSVCAALAVQLSRDEQYKALPRDISRTNAARALLVAHCWSLGLAGEYQGHGLFRAG